MNAKAVFRRDRTPILSRKTREWITAYLFLLPNIISIGGFVVIPLVAGLVISFTDWDLLSPPNWVGSENYQSLWTDRVFWQSLKVTFLYSLMVIPGGLVVSLAIAAALNNRIRGLRIYQMLFFLPYVSSTVAVALVWKWVLNPDYGVVNSFLGLVGLPQPYWLTDPSTAIISVAVVSVWQTAGYNAILLLAAMRSIPAHYYEAARLDGANSRQLFFRVTIPLIMPAIFFVTITSLLNSFIQSFNLIYVMTEGGPGNATKVIMFYVWENAFQFFKMGYASAVSYVLCAILIVIALAQAWLIGRNNEQLR